MTKAERQRKKERAAQKRHERTLRAQERQNKRQGMMQDRIRGQELRQGIKKLRAARRRLLRLAARDCAAKKHSARQREGLQRQMATADAAAYCARGRGKALTQFSTQFAKLGNELWNIRLKYAGSATRKAELKQERDERDEANIRHVNPALLPAWHRYKNTTLFKATKGKGRTRTARWEKFLEWAEENPDEVYQAMDDDAANWLEDMKREQWKLDEGMGATTLPFSRRKKASGGDAPF